MYNYIDLYFVFINDTTLIIPFLPPENAKISLSKGINKDRAMVKKGLKGIREDQLMSKAELARKANVSVITIDRIEKGKPCRLETQRKILLALDMPFSEKDSIFG